MGIYPSTHPRPMCGAAHGIRRGWHERREAYGHAAGAGGCLVASTMMPAKGADTADEAVLRQAYSTALVDACGVM